MTGNNNLINEQERLDSGLNYSRHNIEPIDYKSFYNDMLIRTFGEDYLDKLFQDTKMKGARK